MKKFISAASILFFLIATSSNVQSKTPPLIKGSKVIFEINDKFSEVKLGITKSSVYMIISEEIKDLANTEILNQTNIDHHFFEDSEGNFVIGETQLLTSTKIEFQYSEIKNVSLINGKIQFEYYNKPDLGFENIYTFKGTLALNNFLPKDLEQFISVYNSLT